MRVWLLLWLLALALPAQAGPQVIVVLADHLTLHDVAESGLPGFVWFRQQGQIALMSPGVAHGTHPTANVYASLGAGDSILVGGISQGRLDAALRAAHLRTALIGSADGDDTGPDQPARLIVPDPDLVFNPTVAAPTAPGGGRTDPVRLWAQTQTALRSCALVILHFGDFARLEREQQQGDLMPSAFAAHRRNALQRLALFLQLVLPNLKSSQTLLVVVPTPPLNAHGHWDRLAPLLLAPRRSGGLLLTSDTTQTTGLVAARDLAPTVLHWLHVSVPIQMTGAVLHPVAQEGSLALLLQMNRQTRLNQDAQIPLFWGLGLLAPALIFPLLALYGLGRLVRGSLLCRCASYAMRLLAAWPLSLLLVPLLHPVTLKEYLGEIAAGTALLALLPSPSLIFALMALILIGDGLTGTRLVSQSVLSSYALAGIRFYGIGNEYMGLLIGGALLAAILPRTPPSLPLSKGRSKRGIFPLSKGRSKRGISPPPRSEGEDSWGFRGWGQALWFMLVTFVLSFPSFGAKAGGAVTAVTIFTLAWLRLRGVPLRTKHFAFAIISGFALVFLWAWIGDALHLRRTHLETAVGALQGGRFGYIAGIALRKIKLAGRVFLHGGTLLGLLALALMTLAARALFREHLSTFYGKRPRLAAVSEAGLWGCGICVAFNDSGIVAAILLAMCLILPALHGMFGESCASSPSMSAMSESASPSATL